MRFILTPVGSAGDVHPFVGIGRALKARGHEVVRTHGRTVRRGGTESRFDLRRDRVRPRVRYGLEAPGSVAPAARDAPGTRRSGHHTATAVRGVETAPSTRPHRSCWTLDQFLYPRIRRSAPRPGGHDSPGACHLQVRARAAGSRARTRRVELAVVAETMPVVVHRSIHARPHCRARAQRVATGAWTCTSEACIQRLDPLAATSDWPLPRLVRQPAA